MVDARFEGELRVSGGEPLRLCCLTPADGDLLYRFFAALSPQSREWFRPHWPWDRATAAAVAAGAAGPGEIRFLALARAADEERPAGYGFLVRLQSERPVLGIAVADAYQERGLGQALMRHLVGVARELGKRAVSLTVDDDNRRARHVYEKTGFREVRLIREMELRLDD